MTFNFRPAKNATLNLRIALGLSMTAFVLSVSALPSTAQTFGQAAPAAQRPAAAPQQVFRPATTAQAAPQAAPSQGEPVNVRDAVEQPADTATQVPSADQAGDGMPAEAAPDKGAKPAHAKKVESGKDVVVAPAPKRYGAPVYVYRQPQPHYVYRGHASHGYAVHGHHGYSHRQVYVYPSHGYRHHAYGYGAPVHHNYGYRSH